MNIWIINHYAMPPEYEMRPRTMLMAKYLQEFGHDVKIFSASTFHNTDINLIDKKGPLFIDKNYDGLEYVHIKTSDYSGNGFSRIKNMFEFPFRFRKISKQIMPNPDVIICDLGAVLAPIPYFVSKKKKSRFVLEVRDLWPESIIEYMGLSRKNILVKLMYSIEKWIYKKADKLVFTMEGGRDYIIDKGWDLEHGGPIDLDKVHHINNGVDLDEFDKNKARYTFNDDDLDDSNLFKVVYAGSIRQANNVKTIVDAAFVIKKLGFDDVKFLFYGDGGDRVPLTQYCTEKGLDNVVFKGNVEKKYIPYILSKSDLNILHFEQNSLKKYGPSLNKMFEYFASGKPTLSDCEFGYDIINRCKAGVSIDITEPEHLAEEIIKFYEMDDKQYCNYCLNALRAAKDYDYKHLIYEFESVISN